MLEVFLTSRYQISKREIALLLLQEDDQIFNQVKEQEGERLGGINQIIKDTKALFTQPLSYIIGLPKEASETFVFGFFRRDYGAAGLYDLQSAGLLTARQLVVACATLTLFVPCVAQFTIMIKERGYKSAIAMALIIFPFAFIMGILLNVLLKFMGVLG